MIDTHAHLSKRFCDVIEAKGVKVVLAASNLAESRENIDLTKANQGQFFASVGIHPQKTDPENKSSIGDQLIILDDMAKSNDESVVAIGETGLDYSPAPPEEENRSKADQEKLFRGQIEIAKKFKLPLIIHARKAVDEVIEILKEYHGIKGVFHCYAGGKKRIKKVLELGDSWYFGIDGNVTYEVGLTEVAAEIPKDKLILETDCPFLTPIPHRGEINRPEYVRFVYEKIAEIWETSFEETEKTIDKNVERLFNLNSRR